MLDEISKLIEEFQPFVEQSIYDASIGGFIRGASATLDADSAKVLREESPSEPTGERINGKSLVYPKTAAEPEVHFEFIDKAVKRLQELKVLQAEDFYQLDAAARQQAFTISGDLTNEALTHVRNTLAQHVANGDGRWDFIEEQIDKLPLSAARLDAVYRYAANNSYTDGAAKTLAHPIVADLFPYRAYYAIHDDRTEKDHLAMETYGLNGTNVYLATDPVWQEFMPPWGQPNCRCGWAALTIGDAAALGVKHAQQWQKNIEQARYDGTYTDNDADYMPPAEYVPHPPFSPKGWTRKAIL